MNRLRRWPALVVFGWILCSSAYATMGDEGDSSPEPSAEIRSAGKAYIEALHRGDAKAMAAHWTADGVYVDADGHSFNAHEMIEQHFGGKQAKETIEQVPDNADSTFRFVTPEVAVEEGTSRAPSAAGEELVTGGYSAIWVKKNNRWLLDSLREWVSADVAPTNPLDALSWLIGDWVGQGEGFVVTTSAHWSENQKFIVRRFSVKHEDGQMHTGTQRIGWDPAAQSIRSWVFDSDGGIVEGVWSREGDAWIIKTGGVLADGSRYSGANFLVHEGDDCCVLKSSHVTVDGVEVENSVMEFQRTQLGQ